MSWSDLIWIAPYVLIALIVIIVKKHKKRKSKGEGADSPDNVTLNAQETNEQAYTQNTQPISGEEYRKPITPKIIIGFILVIWAYISAVFFVVYLNICPEELTIPIILAILFVVLGSTGFFLTVNETNTFALLTNIASRPCVAIVYLLMCAVIFIINIIRNSNLKVQNFSLNRRQSVVVNDDGYKRYLEFKENKIDYDGYGTNPNYGKNYQLYMDDINMCWRSYDGGSTFIKTGYSNEL